MATGSVGEKLAIDGGTPVRTRPFGPTWIFGEEEDRYLLDTMAKARQGWRSAGYIQAFEEKWAEMHGVKHAFTTDSGTGAIHAAVAAVNPEPGDEIITTAVTDIGSVLGIMLQNAIPVFADWQPDIWNTDPADLESRITERTRAIIAVHFAGNPCDMDAIMDIARRRNLVVIEDCSHAHFAEYKGQLVGTIGDMACYSLGGKLITAGGGGGMFMSSNDELTRRAIGFAHKGSEYDDELRHALRPTSDQQGSPRGYLFLGDYHRLSQLMAAVGLAQLERLDETMGARERMAEIVDEMVFELPGFRRPKVREGDKTSYYFYGFRIVEEEMGASYRQFSEALNAEGIPCNPEPILGGLPLYKYPIFAEGNTYGESHYPFVDEQGNRRIDYKSMSLPVIERELPGIGVVMSRSTDTEEDARDIGTGIRKVALHFSGRR